MNRFSNSINLFTLITLLFVAQLLCRDELRGWFPKGSSTYLLMRETHYKWVYSFGC